MIFSLGFYMVGDALTSADYVLFLYVFDDSFVFSSLRFYSES